jgi:hypothetical protein
MQIVIVLFRNTCHKGKPDTHEVYLGVHDGGKRAAPIGLAPVASLVTKKKVIMKTVTIARRS